MSHRSPRSAAARVRRRRDAGGLAQEAGRHRRPRREPRRPRDRQGGARSAGAGRRACIKELKARDRRDRDQRPAAGGHRRAEPAARRCQGAGDRRRVPPSPPRRRSRPTQARRNARRRRPAKLSPGGAPPGRGKPLDPASIAGSRPRWAHHQGRRRAAYRRGQREPRRPAGEGQAGARRRRAPGRAVQRVPMTRLRARIAERLVEAQATQAMLTTFNEVDMQAVMDAALALQGQPSRSAMACGSASCRSSSRPASRRCGGSRWSMPRWKAATSSITSTSTSASRSRPTAA